MNKQLTTRTKVLTSLLLMLFGLSLVTALPQSALAQRRSSNEFGRAEYTGNLIYIGGTRGTVATNFTLRINSLTPEAQVQNITNSLRRGGQDELMRAIGKDKRGTLQIGTQIARDINAVWVTEEEEGRKITVLFERWLGFWELRRGARSVDYPFTYLELYIDDTGKGEGMLIPAARVRYKSGNTIEVENFGIYPAHLTNVKVRRR